jgi:hypothetical protein
MVCVSDRSKELIVTAATGMAAFNMRGETLHSALGIAVDRKKNIKKSQKKTKRMGCSSVPLS